MNNLNLVTGELLKFAKLSAPEIIKYNIHTGMVAIIILGVIAVISIIMIVIGIGKFRNDDEEAWSLLISIFSIILVVMVAGSIIYSIDLYNWYHYPNAQIVHFITTSH